MAVYEINSVMRLKREAFSLTREDICELFKDTLSVMTLYRMEKGETAVKQKNFVPFMEYIGELQERGYGAVKVDDIRYLNVKSDITMCLSRGETEEAEKKFEILKEHLDKDYIRNKQYILYMESWFQYLKGKITLEEYEKELWRVLQYTIPKASNIDISEWPLNMAEFQILMDITGVYRMQKQTQKELELLYKLKMNIERKYMEEDFYVIWHACILYNIANILGNLGEHEAAIKYSLSGYEEKKQAGMIGKISYLLYDIVWNQEQLMDKGIFSAEKREECKEKLRQAYYLSIASKEENLTTFLKEHCERLYPNEVILY